MESKIQYYNKKEYIDIRKGNIINKKTFIPGIKNIRHSGKFIIEEACIIRGDLAKISLGKYVIIKKGSTIHPSSKISKKGVFHFLKMEIGDYVLIGDSSII